MGKFIIKATKTGFTFSLKAGNGEVIATGGEVYNTLASVKNGIASVAKNAPEANLEDQTVEGFQTVNNPKFEIYKDKSGECLEMLRRDFERSKTLKHPCLETCYEFLDDSPVGPAIVMDYVPCRTLREYIAENPSRKDRRRMLGQLLDVTAYCHSKGILLNDLSPMTVMVAKEGDCVRLSGFGITPEDAHLLVKSKCMNWDYSSKELRNRARDIDVRSDIFSIGKIMSELLDGSYKGISRKCASKNPAKRFDSVDGILASMEPKKSHAWVLGLVLVLASILG